MKAISKKSRKKARTEHEDVDEDEEAHLAARQRYQHFLDPAVPVDAVEGEREDARADQDEDDEGGQLGGGFDRLPHQIAASAAASSMRKNERAGRAHRAAFGRRRDADEDGAEHEEDQRERRHHHERLRPAIGDSA